MTDRDDIRHGILAAIPSLRAFAISLGGNSHTADDLVQETIVRALAHLDSFEPGTNLKGWLFTILRNHFHTLYRNRRREVEDPDGIHALMLTAPPEQDGHVNFEDLKVALVRLTVEQREALLLVAAEGVSYDEAAAICGTRPGTIKSRVNRARNRLAEMMGYDRAVDAPRSGARPHRLSSP